MRKDVHDKRGDTVLNEMMNCSESAEGLVVCVKDSNAVVLEQNAACIRLCGNRVATECHIGCMELFENDSSQQWQDWGSRIYKNRFLHNQYFDVTMISTSNRIVTVLQSLYDKYRQALAYYSGFSLSRRETQIMEMVIRGMPNQEISETLFISVSTLRTHLKNIYNKVKDAGGSISFLPQERRE